MAIQTINPATGKTEKVFKEHSSHQVMIMIDAANDAFLKWRETDYSLRVDLMKNAAQILREKKEHYGNILTLEMGKTVIQAIAEVEKCALVCEYYSKKLFKQMLLKVMSVSIR